MELRAPAKFLTFMAHQIGSGDIDPVYPVLRKVAEALEATEEERTLLVFLHVAWYNLPSAVAEFLALRRGLPRGCETLPTGTERRGHRDVRKLAAHLRALFAAETAGGAGGLEGWVASVLEGDPVRDWRSVRRRVEELEGNGGWASYKTAEMLAKVCDWPLRADELGLDGAAGPRKGLADLIAEERTAAALEKMKVAEAEELGRAVYEALASFALPEGESRTLPGDYANFETALCDWHSLLRGRYYLGHDIDALQAQCYQLATRPGAAAAELAAVEAVLEARPRALDPHYLGEVMGWSGVDVELRRAYRDTGRLILRRGRGGQWKS